MEEKTVKSAKVFYHSEVTTLEGIHDIAVREIDNMYAEAEKIGLKETAPMQFVYYGCDDKPDTKFTLEIAMLIDGEKPYEGKYKFKELEDFKCVSTIHKGSISDLGKTYEKFMPELFKSGKEMTGQSREVYHKYVQQDSPENVTEIQIGVN
ncbi:MAG: GyrI-like domain-containing protein [Cytophagales bacterium]|nr:GyrI-like domain-containing protein [Cytophagales bacterium]